MPETLGRIQRAYTRLVAKPIRERPQSLWAAYLWTWIGASLAHVGFPRDMWPRAVIDAQRIPGLRYVWAGIIIAAGVCMIAGYLGSERWRLARALRWLATFAAFAVSATMTVRVLQIIQEGSAVWPDALFALAFWIPSAFFTFICAMELTLADPFSATVPQLGDDHA